jgi:2',3'-cyclic-nucleotide 2'-phosphodiesterase
MKNPDAVFRELGQLYEFYREIAKLRFKIKPGPEGAGKPGRKAVALVLPELKKKYQPDVTIANAENLAHGVGVTQKTLDECRAAGIDFFTSGNHIWRKEEVNEMLSNPAIPLIRPDNYPPGMAGTGHKILTLGKHSLLVINLNGRVFIDGDFASPFQAIDDILRHYADTDIHGTLVDFHAEATSEKVAFGHHVDGRVAAVLGTHTHVPTADERILPGGTAYITDVGMAGLKDSVIGVDKDIIIEKFVTEKGRAHDITDHGRCVVNAVFVTIDPQSRRAEHIERVYREAEV